MRLHFRALAVGVTVAMGMALATVVATPAGASSVVRSGESIQAAIDAASPGATIVVFGAHAGIHTGLSAKTIPTDDPGIDRVIARWHDEEDDDHPAVRGAG